MATDEPESSQLGAFCTSKNRVKTWSDDLYSKVRHTRSWYRNEIKKLKAEISTCCVSLEKLSDVETPSNNVLNEVVSRAPVEKRPLLKDLDVKGKHAAGGTIDIDWLKQFTGVCIDNVSVNMRRITAENTIEREHCLTGSCYDVRFKVAFLVEEIGCEAGQEESFGADKCPRISRLHVSIENELAHFDMKKALDQIEEELQIQQCFLMLQNYSKLRYQRQNTFRHFCQKYHELVLAPHNETVLTVCNPEYPAIRINIVWNILVTAEGQARAVFDLLSGIPAELNDQDRKGLLKKLRDKFCHLLKAVGVEKAIDVIITILAK